MLKSIADVAPNWEPIGSLLGIHGDTLTAISNDNSASVDKCLIDMVMCWLQHNYDTSRHGLPTWERLVQVIASPTGGNSTILALTIAQQHNVFVQQPIHMVQTDHASQQSQPYSSLLPDTDQDLGISPSPMHQYTDDNAISSNLVIGGPLSPMTQTDSPHPCDEAESQMDLPSHYIKKPVQSAMTSEMLYLYGLVEELKQEYVTNYYETKKRLKKYANFNDVQDYVITHISSMINADSKALRQTFKEATTFEQLFDKLTNYTSWYNYDLIVNLSRQFLRHNHKIRRKWRSYEDKLKEYLTLGVGVTEYYNPVEFGEHKNGDRKVFAVKVPSEKLVKNDLIIFHKALAKSLKQIKFALYFCSIQRGCLELKYSIPKYLHLDISNALPQAMKKYLPQLGIGEVHWNGKKLILDKVSCTMPRKDNFLIVFLFRYQIHCYFPPVSWIN